MVPPVRVYIWEKAELENRWVVSSLPTSSSLPQIKSSFNIFVCKTETVGQPPTLVSEGMLSGPRQPLRPWDVPGTRTVGTELG